MDNSSLTNSLISSYSDPSRIGRANVILKMAMEVGYSIANAASNIYTIKPILDVSPDDTFLEDTAKKNFIKNNVMLMLIKLMPFTIDNEGMSSYVRTDTLVIELVMKHLNITSDFTESSYYKFKELEEMVQEGFETSGCWWHYQGLRVGQYRSTLTGDKDTPPYINYSNILCHYSKLTSTFTEAFNVTKDGLEMQ